MHEYGIDEDALRVDDWLFRESQIKDAAEIPCKKIAIWQNRTQHSFRIPSFIFQQLDNGERELETRMKDEDWEALHEQDVIRFEDSEDETELIRLIIIRKDENEEGMRRLYFEEME